MKPVHPEVAEFVREAIGEPEAHISRGEDGILIALMPAKISPDCKVTITFGDVKTPERP